MRTYILGGDDGHTPVPCDLKTWAKWFEKANRHVAVTTQDNIRVSTVFLGLNHRWSGNGPPILFETLVFGGKFDHEMVRYSNWDDALAGHQAMVRRALKTNKAK